MANSEWKPKRTIAECNSIMTAKGALHETELQVVDGKVTKVYKNLWPSLRTFFLAMVKEHKDKELIVFEKERLSYNQVLAQALKVAAVMHDTYGVRKGDKVAIISRNYPEYITTFWAIAILGGVATMVNAWLPSKPLHHCIEMVKPKIIFVDGERAVKLDIESIRRKSQTKQVVVYKPEDLPGQVFPKTVSWNDFCHSKSNDPKLILEHDFGIVPEDDATIFFTSGTTGLPKGVLSTQRMFLTNTLNCLAARPRSFLRRGETPPPPDFTGPQKSALLSVPLFHVTGLEALVMLCHVAAWRVILIRKWDPAQAGDIIRRENVVMAGGVPSMVSDLIESSAAGAPSMETFMFGGAPAHIGLVKDAAKAFPTAVLSQAYGLTETNAVCVAHAGEDYAARPTSCGVAAPVNEVIIVKDNVIQKPGEVGEVWIKGADIMKGYYDDPVATAQAITPDGWFKSGDLGTLDHEGFLFIKDRAKDIIIRGGENIDSVSVENALYADQRVMEVAAVGVPDKRLGELVAAVVTLKKGFYGEIKEKELIQLCSKSLPRFAVPVMVVISREPLERNPAGKILKVQVRKFAASQWEQRKGKNNAAASKL